MINAPFQISKIEPSSTIIVYTAGDSISRQDLSTIGHGEWWWFISYCKHIRLLVPIYRGGQIKKNVIMPCGVCQLKKTSRKIWYWLTFLVKQVLKSYWKLYLHWLPFFEMSALYCSIGMNLKYHNIISIGGSALYLFPRIITWPWQSKANLHSRVER